MTGGRMLLAALLVGLPVAAAASAEPDQVLVLYNRDWTGDLPGTEPGQDSEEVARYYVARHTDPKTGKRPHLLGLTCHHKATVPSGSHLNGSEIAEASRDNYFGVVYRGQGSPPAVGEGRRSDPLLVSTHIEANLPADAYEWATVTLKVGSTDDEAAGRTVYAEGRSETISAVHVTDLPGGGKRFEVDAERIGYRGAFHVWLSVKDRDGEVLVDERTDFADYGHVVIPLSGDRLDWSTLEAVVGDTTDAKRRMMICRGGESTLKPHVRVDREARDGHGALRIDARAAGWAGDFFVAWRARTADGQVVTAPSTVVRDPRQVRFTVPDPDGKLDWHSVTLRIGARADPDAARVLYADGRGRLDEPIVRVREPQADRSGRDEPGRTLFLNAKRAGYDGDVWVWLSARGRAGEPDLRHSRHYVDPDDLAFSWTGPDGVRDDAHYLEDIEAPVKAFLEDPARPADGRHLKDHVLYIVLCYGLPRIVARHGGIAQTAVPASRTDSGHLVSLCQRLEMTYYGIEAVRPPRVVPVRMRDTDGPWRKWAAVSSLWSPLVGRAVQPYMHPAAYRTGRFTPEVPPPWPDPPHFTSELRRRMSDRFVYACSRIDGPDPETAMYQVDAASYASRYLTPRIGSRPEGEWDGEKALRASRDVAGVGELERLGLPGAGKSINFSAYFGRRDGGGYVPGAVDWYVISANSVGSSRSHVTRALAGRVTVTGGAARSYGGCPHTTTHGWWDSRVFYHYLFRGYDLGEAWLLSRYKYLWSTSFFGDPLYRPDLARTEFDTTPPRVAAPDGIRVEVVPAGDQYYAVVTAEVASTAEEPELVTARAEYAPEGQGDGPREAVDGAYRRRPRVVLRPLEPETGYKYHLVLSDPYLNTFDSRERPGKLTFRTGPAGAMDVAAGRDDPKTLTLGGPGRLDQPNGERGEIEITYVPPEAGNATVLACGDLRVRLADGKVEFNPGGGTGGRADHPLEAGRPYHMRLRYRQWPVTREVWLVARDGSEFLLCSDNRTPWRELRLSSRMTFAQSADQGFVRHARLFADARPGADAGTRRKRRFQPAAFDRVDRAPGGDD